MLWRLCTSKLGYIVSLLLLSVTSLATMLYFSTQRIEPLTLSDYYHYRCDMQPQSNPTLPRFRFLAVSSLYADTIAERLCQSPLVAQYYSGVTISWKPRWLLSPDEVINENYDLIWSRENALNGLVPGFAEYYQLLMDFGNYQVFWFSKDTRNLSLTQAYFSDKLEIAARLLPLEGGRNFRDLGGYATTDGRTVKWGKIYRSGVLAGLTEQDYQFIDELDIKTIVDFRANSERSSEVTKWHDSEVKVIQKDYEMDFDFSEIGTLLRRPDLSKEMLEGMMAQFYPKILDDQKQNYTEMFSSLVNSDDGLLFHCTAGKDRTGVSAVLVLSALGVDKQTAIDDYLATNHYLDPRALMPKNNADMDPKMAAMMKMFASLPPEVAQPLVGVTQPLIEAAIAKMEAEHGTILEYIKQELDVSDDDLLVLRQKYLN